ncbi:MAG TPA: hypothetical protein VKY92_23125, partial [Verrucomicrobiae bacterium]|nr:hypothetical protein [Verrucomicrobiae bacterium]
KSQSLSVQAGEQQLVDFLYDLGSGNSQIRVRDLSVRPDPPRQQLVAQVKLVASYQKKPTARPAGRPAAPAPTRATASQGTPLPLAASESPEKTSKRQ